LDRYSTKTEGVVEIATPFGGFTALKTFTCGHCGGIGVSQPEGLEGKIILSTYQAPAVCHRCWTLVCPQCHAKGNCVTVEQLLTEIENHDRFLKSAGLS
jgi:hypothetical protein